MGTSWPGLFASDDPCDYPPCDTKSGPEPAPSQSTLKAGKVCGLEFCWDSKCEADCYDFLGTNHQSNGKNNWIPSSEVPARLARMCYIQLGCLSAGCAFCVSHFLRGQFFVAVQQRLGGRDLQ